jgi:hypothetical protein
MVDETRVSTLMIGSKPLVLMFWTARSQTSVRLLPRFQKVYDLYREDVAFLALDVGEYTTQDLPEDAYRVLESLHVTVPAGRTPIEEVLIAYQVRILPTVFFVDEGWQIQARRSGDLKVTELDVMVARLLGGSLGQPPPGSVQAGLPGMDDFVSAQVVSHTRKAE